MKSNNEPKFKRNTIVYIKATIWAGSDELPLVKIRRCSTVTAYPSGGSDMDVHAYVSPSELVRPLAKPTKQQPTKGAKKK